MATVRFLLSRFAAQRLLGLAVVITLAFTTGVLVAGPVYADAAREAILSSALRDAAVTVTNARFQVYGGTAFDWARADDAVTAAARRLPLDHVVRQGLATVRLGGPGGPSVPLLFRDGAGGNLAFTGRPPGAGEIAIVANTPQTIGLRIGDRVVIVGPAGGRMALTVSGTFEPPSAGDPFWFGSDSPFPGPGSTAPQPALVSRDAGLRATERLGLTTQLSWDAYLALADVPFVQARTLPAQLREIAGSLAGQPGLGGIRVLSGLDTLIQIVDQRVENLRIPILLVVFQIGAVTLAVLAGVGALALTRQSFELAVLHSRGFSRRLLLVAQGVQAALAALLAYPLGLVIGLGLAHLASRSNGPTLPGVLFPVRLSGPAEVLGLTGVLSGVLILLLLSAPHISRTVLEERRVASREDRPLLSRLPVELVILPVGIFALIQLRGGTRPSPGSGTIDPLVLLAPTLLLFASSFLALRLLLFGVRRLDRRIGRSRRIALYLAARKLGRSPGTGFASALLLLLSVGLLVVSTSYRAIVLRNHEDAARTIVGADWNVQVAAPANVLEAIRGLPPGTTPVVRTEPTLGAGSYALPPTALGIDPATFARGGWWRSDFSRTSLSDLLAALRTTPSGMALPTDARTLSISLDAPPAAAGLRLSATVLDESGAARTPDPQPIAPGTGRYRIPLAPGTRLLSITFQADTTMDLPSRLSFTVRADIDGSPVPLTGWQALTWRGSSGRVSAATDGIRLDAKVGAGDVVAGLIPAPAPMPAVLSPSVAAALGDRATVTMGGEQIELRQVGVAEQFPSTVPNAPFIVVPTQALLEREIAVPEAGLTLSEVWSMGAVSPVPALRAEGLVPGRVRRAAPIEARLAQLPQSLAVGMNFTAAASGATLVVIGVAAGLYFAQRRRDFEFAALRAMGAERAQIRRAVVLEQSILLGFSVVAGLGLGFLLLLLVMPDVGTSLGVSYPPPVLVVDWRSLGFALAAIVGATALGLALAVRSLMRSSVTGVLRGEAE